MSDYKVGDKFVVEIVKLPKKAGDMYEMKSGIDAKLFMFDGILDNLEKLDSDYVNENFGVLQDEAYEAGKKQA